MSKAACISSNFQPDLEQRHLQIRLTHIIKLGNASPNPNELAKNFAYSRDTAEKIAADAKYKKRVEPLAVWATTRINKFQITTCVFMS